MYCEHSNPLSSFAFNSQPYKCTPESISWSPDPSSDFVSWQSERLTEYFASTMDLTCSTTKLVSWFSLNSQAWMSQLVRVRFCRWHPCPSFFTNRHFFISIAKLRAKSGSAAQIFTASVWAKITWQPQILTMRVLGLGLPEKVSMSPRSLEFRIKLSVMLKYSGESTTRQVFFDSTR